MYSITNTYVHHKMYIQLVEKCAIFCTQVMVTFNLLLILCDLFSLTNSQYAQVTATASSITASNVSAYDKGLRLSGHFFFLYEYTDFPIDII